MTASYAGGARSAITTTVRRDTPLDDINRVFEAVHHREIRRRAVLVP